MLQLLKPYISLMPVRLSLYGASVAAGFPSPADDYIEGSLDLNEHLIKSPASTFIARASGTSMKNAGILDGALLIVDRSVTAGQGDIVIAAVDGELTCKYLDIRGRCLVSANPRFRPIPITDESGVHVMGVVMHVINRTCSHS